MQVVALRAAKNGGIEVPQQTIDDAIDYVRRCRFGGAGGFSYPAGRGPDGFARTGQRSTLAASVRPIRGPLVFAAGSDYLFDKNKPNSQWWTYGCYCLARAV